MNRLLPLFIVTGTLIFLLYGFEYCCAYHAILPKDDVVPSAHIGIVVSTLHKEKDIYTANEQNGVENVSDIETNTVVGADTDDSIYDTTSDNATAVQSDVAEADIEETIETDTTTETVSDTLTNTTTDTATDTATTQAPSKNADDTEGYIEAAQSPSDICLSYPSDLVAAINTYRNSYGLASLSEDSQLKQAAGIRCRELISSMSHTRPDGSSCSTIYAELGIYPYNWGENLAGGHYTASETATAWINSEGHRANILNPSFTKCGVAHISCSSGYRDYWVILFTD